MTFAVSKLINLFPHNKHKSSKQVFSSKRQVRKLKLGPSSRTMIPSMPQIPPRLGCKRSPGRFYSGHHSHLT